MTINQTPEMYIPPILVTDNDGATRAYEPECPEVEQESAEGRHTQPNPEPRDHMDFPPLPWTSRMLTGTGRTRIYGGKTIVAELPYVAGRSNAALAGLIIAASTSYRKHCGPRAVECAEDDLLGQLAEACRAFIDAPREEHLVVRLNDAEAAAVDSIRALLSKLQVKEGK